MSRRVSARPDTQYGTGAAGASALRAGLRSVTESQRERQCGVVAARSEGPALEACGHPGRWKVRWTGVVTCGHVWTCPVCSRRIRSRRLARIDHALTIAGGRWQMVTLTVRHRDGMPLRELVRGLMRAWRRARQGGTTQVIWRQRVTASVRATEITRGRHGWHPHLHVLLRTEEWTDSEREALLGRWIAAVQRDLGDACVPDAAYAIRWSTPIDACRASERERARYLAGLGHELADVGGKRARGRGSMSVWEIASHAVSGDERAIALWREYARATRGRRALEMDDRATAYARTPLPDADASARVGDVSDDRVTVSVDSLELRALREYERMHDPAIMGAIVDSVRTCERPEETVRTWVELVTGWLRRRAIRRPRDGPGALIEQ